MGVTQLMRRQPEENCALSAPLTVSLSIGGLGPLQVAVCLALAAPLHKFVFSHLAPDLGPDRVVWIA
jgi:hypothetical protein